MCESSIHCSVTPATRGGLWLYTDWQPLKTSLLCHCSCCDSLSVIFSLFHFFYSPHFTPLLSPLCSLLVFSVSHLSSVSLHLSVRVIQTAQLSLALKTVFVFVVFDPADTDRSLHARWRANQLSPALTYGVWFVTVKVMCLKCIGHRVWVTSVTTGSLHVEVAVVDGVYDVSPVLASSSHLHLPFYQLLQSLLNHTVGAMCRCFWKREFKKLSIVKKKRIDCNPGVDVLVCW